MVTVVIIYRYCCRKVAAVSTSLHDCSDLQMVNNSKITIQCVGPTNTVLEKVAREGEQRLPFC